MRIEVLSPDEISVEFNSIKDLADTASLYFDEFQGSQGSFRKDWHGVSKGSEVVNLSVNGWGTEVADAMNVAERAIETVTRDNVLPSFHPYWDVTGCEVDVGRYLAREPENMIDYEIVPSTRAGRVIVLCASASYSGAVSTETIKKRGHGIAALAFGLSKLGYSIELWADLSAVYDATLRMRTLVKGANDELDPAKIMFAYSHPAFLRALSLPATHVLEGDWRDRLAVGWTYGRPEDPKEDLPEGSIYMPCVCSSQDVPDADELLLHHMRELGIFLPN